MATQTPTKITRGTRVLLQLALDTKLKPWTVDRMTVNNVHFIVSPADHAEVPQLYQREGMSVIHHADVAAQHVSRWRGGDSMMNTTRPAAITDHLVWA